MNARNRGIGVGFVSGIAVAVACKSAATSVVDAQAADSSATDVGSVDAPLQETTVVDRLRVRTADSDVDQLEEGSKGVRVAVKAGEFLCASNVSDSFLSFEWSGYRPYPANG